MNYILFDDPSRDNLLPLTFTRPISEIRLGILTIREKWELHLEAAVSHLTVDYLSEKYNCSWGEENLLINGSICPEGELSGLVLDLKPGEALVNGNKVLAYNSGEKQWGSYISGSREELPDNTIIIESSHEPLSVETPWDIFSKCDVALKRDYDILTMGRESKAIHDSNQIIGDQVFIEEGANVTGATINSSTGPVYIGKDTQVMEGSLIRGPFAICEHGVVKMGAKIYGATVVGPHCKVGGEISNSVLLGYSNKGHDGFLGNSVIGEWCNLGADTNTSNLKNNYAEVRLWNYTQKSFVRTGLQFCGLIMGDHAKCGINTMFNTGTVVGVSANVFGAGFPRNFVADFSWGGKNGFTTYRPDKTYEVAERMMQRRGVQFDEIERRIFEKVFELTEEYRK